MTLLDCRRILLVAFVLLSTYWVGSGTPDRGPQSTAASAESRSPG